MLVISSDQLELVAVKTAGCVDLINSHLCRVLNCQTVHSSATGQGAGYANDNFRVVGGISSITGISRCTSSEHCDDHKRGHQESEQLFHN